HRSRSSWGAPGCLRRTCPWSFMTATAPCSLEPSRSGVKRSNTRWLDRSALVDIADIYALPAATVIEVDRPGEDDLLRLHRLGFHPTIVTSQSQTMVKQLSHGFALRGLSES